MQRHHREVDLKKKASSKVISKGNKREIKKILNNKIQLYLKTYKVFN